MQAKPCGRNQKIFKAYKDKSKSWEGDLTKEFYETFWNELKEIVVDSVLDNKEKRHLIIY